MACRKPPSRASYCSKTRSRRRRRRRSRSKRRKCRPGKVTRNPFFNYLRWFRKKHCGWSAVQVAVEGAKCWCKMSDQQRNKFYKEACRAPKMRRRRRGRRGGKRSRSRSRSRRKRSRSRRRRSRSRSSCGGVRRRRRKSRSRSRCSSACNRPRRVQSTC